MLSTVFNVVYVILMTAALVVTAEVFRRRRKAPLRSLYVAVLYAVVILFLPLVFLFGYAGGGSIGFALGVLLTSLVGEPSKVVTTIGAVAGVYIGSYLLGFLGVVVGALLARLAEKLKSPARAN